MDEKQALRNCGMTNYIVILLDFYVQYILVLKVSTKSVTHLFDSSQSFKEFKKRTLRTPSTKRGRNKKFLRKKVTKQINGKRKTKM